MDLPQLLARIADQPRAIAPEEAARLARLLALGRDRPCPFAGIMRIGSFNAQAAQRLGRDCEAPATSVKTAFTFAF